MIQLLPILQGIGAIKKVTDMFRHKNKHTDKVDAVDKALNTIQEFTAGLDKKQDPEALKILHDNAMDMEKLYTERAKAALEVMGVEASSEDGFVRRARPAWLYAGMLILFIQMAIMPFCGVKISDFVDPQALNWFYSIVGAGYLGYGVLRTVDKRKITK